MRLDVLIRTSQRKNEARSPKQQEDICRSCADVNGYEIAMIHDSGGSESGKTMVRATVEAVLARLRAGQTDGVMVAFLDRFGRAPIEEAMAVVREIHRAGGVLVPADAGGQPIRPDDPQAETHLVLQLQMARQQWRMTANRFDRNRKEAISEGKAIGGAPFGYRFVDSAPREGGRGVVDSRLVPDQNAPLVRELFERKARGATWTELARWLDSVAPKDRKWPRNSVSSMIRCRTYLGEVHSGQYVNHTAHKPLVTPALWRRAQNPPGRRTPRGTYLLSGLARCGGCGHPLRGAPLGRNDKRIYTCDGLDCPSKNTIMAHRLDDEVTTQFFARLDTFHLTATQAAESDAARREVETLTQQVENLAAVIPVHPRAIAAHQEALANAEAELIDAEARLQELLDAQTQPDVRRLSDDWPELSLNDRREILRAGIDAILVRRALGSGPASDIPKRILVLFRGAAPRELLDSRKVIRSWAWDDDVASLRLAS